MSAAVSGRNALETTTGNAVGVSASEDASRNNVQIAVWNGDKGDDLTILRFTPTHARLLARLLSECADVVENSAR